MKTKSFKLSGESYKYSELTPILRKMGYKVDGRKPTHHGVIRRLAFKAIMAQEHGFKLVRTSKKPAYLTKQQITPNGILLDLPKGYKNLKFYKYGYSYTVGKVKYKVVNIDKSRLALDPVDYVRELDANYGKGHKQKLIQSNGFDGKTTYSTKKFEDYLTETGADLAVVPAIFTIKYLWF